MGSLTQLAVGIIDQFGYLGLFLSLMLNTMGVPLPSELIIPLAGVAANQGNLEWVPVIVVVLAAQILGATIAHEIGRRGGLPLIRRFGKYILLSERDLKFTHDWFNRYGYWAVLVGFCLPLVRGYVSYVAGIAEVPFSRLLPAALIGAALWTSLLLWLGSSVANNLDSIETIIRPSSLIIAIILVTALGYFIWSRLKERMR